MEKIFKCFTKFFFAIVFSIISLICIFGSLFNASYFGILKILFLVVIAVFMIVALTYASNIVKNRKINDLIFIGSLILFVFLAFIFYHNFAVLPSWDYGVLTEMAKKIHWSIQLSLEGVQYLAAYPWNYSMLLTYVGIYKLFGTEIFSLFALGIITTSISLVFIYLAIRTKYNCRTLFVMQIMLFLFLPFLLYSVISYTDVMALLFTSISVYLLMKIDGRYNFKNLVVLSIVIALGSLYKVIVFIIGIALFLAIFSKKSLFFL